MKNPNAVHIFFSRENNQFADYYWTHLFVTVTYPELKAYKHEWEAVIRQDVVDSSLCKALYA